uniref:TIL domain-containing protein n=1 Tax=Caenorhabditis japonica TaxID=281687 RepID=A0A8R1I2S7_CAEJA
MRFVVVLAILTPITSTVPTNSIDWCEYWARVGKKNELLKTERPECAGYELPAGVKRTEPVSCSKNEVYNCLDCEPTCHNLVPKCRKEQCNKGCVCKNGLARNTEGKCVSFRGCAVHTPPKNDSVKGDEEEGTVMKTMKKMVPVIVNDVWKALFNSMSVTTDAKTEIAKPKSHVASVQKSVPLESVKSTTKGLTTQTPTTTIGQPLVQEKQKGFYIDYP